MAIPLDISMVGTEDDPCFGKLYDMTTRECKRCGDNEFCALVMMGELKKQRKRLERKQKFKDIDSVEYDNSVGYHKFIKTLKATLRKYGKPIQQKKLSRIFTEKKGYKKETYKNYLETLLKKATDIQIDKNDKISLL